MISVDFHEQIAITYYEENPIPAWELHGSSHRCLPPHTCATHREERETATHGGMTGGVVWAVGCAERIGGNLGRCS